MLIYFAGPLFCQAEKTFNLKLTEKLEGMGFSVFLPQRDGIGPDKPLHVSLTGEDRVKKIFDTDRKKILQADIFLLVLDGRVPDEGACVELGIAYEQRCLTNKDKLLVGLKTDWRVFSSDFKINAMVLGALDCVLDSEIDLVQRLETFREDCGKKN